MIKRAENGGRSERCPKSNCGAEKIPSRNRADHDAADDDGLRQIGQRFLLVDVTHKPDDEMAIKVFCFAVAMRRSIRFRAGNSKGV